jgi:1-acyl-sn-glycerol-3-phosphate acyltransferase
MADLAGRFLYGTFKHLLAPPVKLFWLKRVDGLEHLAPDGPLILAANHSSFLDFALIVAVSPRRIYFLVEDFFYHIPVLAQLLRATGQVRVSKTQPLAAIEEAARILTRGDVLGVFPEGTRSWTGKPQKAFAGLGKMALDARTDIVPVAIIGAFEVYPRQRKLPRFKKICAVEFLEPVKYAEAAGVSPRVIVHGMVMPPIARALGHEHEYRKGAPA